MVNKELVEFVKEARKRGFGDITIRNALITKKWPISEIEKAFTSLETKVHLKNEVRLFFDDDLLTSIEKRAKKNLLSVSEQIEDIVRRSMISQKSKNSVSSYNDKLDDNLIGLFSRKRTGRKKK